MEVCSYFLFSRCCYCCCCFSFSFIRRFWFHWLYTSPYTRCCKHYTLDLLLLRAAFHSIRSYTLKTSMESVCVSIVHVFVLVSLTFAHMCSVRSPRNIDTTDRGDNKHNHNATYLTVLIIIRFLLLYFGLCVRTLVRKNLCYSFQQLDFCGTWYWKYHYSYLLWFWSCAVPHTL